MSQENRRCSEGADPVRGADEDTDHTAEGCARKFAEVRPLFASDRDPGDEDDGGRLRLLVFRFRLAPGERVQVGQGVSIGDWTERATEQRPSWWRRAWRWLRGRFVRERRYNFVYDPRPLRAGFDDLAERIRRDGEQR